MMDYKWVGLFAAMFMSTVASAQSDSSAIQYAKTITQADLRAHLTVLASDEYEGRETGYKGQKMAASYIVNHFKSLGIKELDVKRSDILPNGYEQTFKLDLKKPGGIALNVDGQRYEFLDDILYFNKELKRSETFAEVMFGGYGLRSTQHDDLADIKCDDCAMLVLAGVPETKGGVSKVDMGGKASGMQLMNIKSKAAAAAGAKVVLLVSDRINNMRGQFGNYLRSSRMSLASDELVDNEEQAIQTILISEELANVLLKKGGSSLAKEKKKLNKKGPRSRNLGVNLNVSVESMDSTVFAENVLGYIPGKDKKDELVVITAHYDHVGVMDGKVFNGADDDGSGTVALLELAQAFSMAVADGNGPRRSMLFMTVSGEEKGLLGSEFYSENPVFPLENTIVDLNIDMIGRHDAEHEENRDYVYIIGSDRLSTDLHEINEAANKEYLGMELDYTFNAPDDPNKFYYRSDHYNFARKGIPVIFYFTGVHDDYHQPGDDVEKIEFNLLERRTKLVFHTAWELANRANRIVVDGELETD